MKYVKQLELFQILFKNGKLGTGRLLGMDVGDRYVGLAVSNHLNEIASPHSVLIRKQSNINSIADKLQELAMQVKMFVEQLQKTGRFGCLNYTYWDERFTTRAVESMLKPLKIHPLQMKHMMDKFAAVGILQDFLDNLQHQAKSCGQSDSLRPTI